MTARHRMAPQAQLTIDEFLTFTATRPDGVRWERRTEHRSSDARAIFEVLSRSNSKTDQARRKVYASVPSCQHYVTASLRDAELTAYDRYSGWAGRTAKERDSALDLPGLGMRLALTDVYQFTPIGA